MRGEVGEPHAGRSDYRGLIRLEPSARNLLRRRRPARRDLKIDLAVADTLDVVGHDLIDPDAGELHLALDLPAGAHAEGLVGERHGQ